MRQRVCRQEHRRDAQRVHDAHSGAQNGCQRGGHVESSASWCRAGECLGLGDVLQQRFETKILVAEAIAIDLRLVGADLMQQKACIALI